MLSEKTVSLIWQYQLVSELITLDGERIEVVFPGIEGNERGCDFSDAVFTCGGRAVYGNVEVHVKSSQWYGHGHHNDANYNKVVLHVVMWHDCDKPTRLQNGGTVPTICLQPFVTGPLPEDDHTYKGIRDIVPFSCTSANLYSNSDLLLKNIEQAGITRFLLKADIFAGRMIMGEKEEIILLKHISRALGYISNIVPFEKLAGLLTSNGLEYYLCEDICVMQALILGTAGLLPFQRSGGNRDTYILRERDRTGLESIGRKLDIKYSMQEHEWCLYRVRPQNHPVRRQIALSLLLKRYRDRGLLNGIIELFTDSHVDRLNHALLNGLETCGDGYWSDHADFGVYLKHETALLGKSKAGDIVVNVALPFIAAWAELYSDASSRKKALNAYVSFPRLAENHITRHMKEQVFQYRKVKMTACRQQGFIHIYRTYCRYRNCAECPISKIK